MAYFDCKTDYLGYPVEHIIGKPWKVRHVVQLLRKWLHLHRRIAKISSTVKGSSECWCKLEKNDD